MRIIRTDKQKDNLAKAFWDMGKIIFTVLVISPFAKLEAVNIESVSLGFLTGLLSWILGYVIDGMEVKS